MTVELHPAERQRILDEIETLTRQIQCLPLTYNDPMNSSLQSVQRIVAVSPDRARPILRRFMEDLYRARIEELGERLANPASMPAND